MKHVSYHKLYDILKQHQHEVNEIRAEKIARVANPLALVAQQQQVYHPQTHPTHYNQHSSTRTHQAANKNRGKAVVNSPQPIYDQEPFMVDDDEDTTHQAAIRKREKAIVNSPQPIYDQEPSMVDDDDEMSKEKEIDKLIALISLSRANQDNSPRIHRNTRAKDAAYHREKMVLCKQEEAGIQLNAEQADWMDDTNDESDDQELEAHYMYMAKLVMPLFVKKMLDHNHGVSSKHS
nr:hypothetical protein [Tanacetum cinerariifolium]